MRPLPRLNHITDVIRLAAASLVVSGPWAFEVRAQENATEADVEKIAVVGSRSSPRSVGDSAVPVDIISAAEFRNQGATDMVSMMQSVVPSFNVNDQPINDASTLVRPANLRGLAPDHTLVLVNGKRRHRSAVITFLGGQISDGAQGPDISTIPAVALKQVEVLRDGAAAQYGSDAIAGVINFALNDADEGGIVEARYGAFFAGDGDTVQYSANLGLPLTDAGYVNLSAEYREADATSRSVQRDDAQALINAGNTFVSDLVQIWGSPQVDDDIKLFINAGVDLSETNRAYVFGNYAERSVDGGFYFRNPHTRSGVNDGGTDDEGNALLLVGDLDGLGQGLACPQVPITANVLESPAFQIIADNSTDIGENCFAFNELFPGGFTPRFGGTVTDRSLALGTEGELSTGLGYDISVYAGESEIDFRIRNTINPSLGPDTPTAFEPGRYIQTERALNLDVNQSFDVGMAEPLFLAGGMEFRYERFEAIAGDPASFAVGPLAAQGFGIGSNGFPGLATRFAGQNSRNSHAVYLDSEVYLSEYLMLGVAMRYEDFSDFGNTTNGKVSFHYTATNTLALRGAFATGFKAPTIGQSNVRNVTTAFTANGLADRATLPPTDPVAQLKGAKPLQPEASTSYSLGVVGEFVQGLFVTLDYFNIELEDRISTTSGIELTDADILTLLANGVNDASSFSEISFFANDFTTTTQGIDIVANYALTILGGETLFALAYNWTQTRVDAVRTFDNGNGPQTNVSDTRIRMLEDNLPAVRYSFTANHTYHRWRILGRLNYFGSTFEDHLDSGLPIDEISSELTLDVEFAYQFTDNVNVVLGARNALDNEPDRNALYDNEEAGSAFPITSPIGINGGFYYLRAMYTF